MINDYLVQKELRRIDFEMKEFGEPLLVSDGTSQKYWWNIRKKLGIKWWQFWVDETKILTQKNT